MPGISHVTPGAEDGFYLRLAGDHHPGAPTTKNVPMKIIALCGSPYALPTLRHFIKSGDLSALICPIDSIADDSAPLEEWAAENELPCWHVQMSSLENDLRELVQETAPDLVMVYGFPYALPFDVLKDIPYGCWNIHFSLQPNNYGGITIHQLMEDKGSQVLHQCNLSLLPEQQYGTSLHQLSLLSVELLQAALDKARTSGYIDRYFRTVA